MPVSPFRPLVALASIMHESNSFNPEPTTFEKFTFYGGTSDDEKLQRWSNGSTDVAGMIEEGTRAGFRFAPILYASATPAGPVEMEAFEKLCHDLTMGLAATGKLDGVLLALHGAMFTPIFPHADEEITRRVRAAIGPNVPLVVTHDFHANIPPSMVELTNALVTYQKNPHTDTRDRGARAASILAAIIKGEVTPKQALVKPQLLWNIAFQSTSEEPLKGITEASIALEQKPGVLAASVAGGYQYNDVPHMGPSVVVVCDSKKVDAQREAQTLADMMWNRRDAIRLNLPDPAEAVQDAISSDSFPVALFDIGDNIGGGSAGDETTLLAELIKQEAKGWVFVLYDPAAVAVAKKAGIGGAFDREVGAHSAGVRSQPIRVSGNVRSLGSGEFVEPEVRHGGQRYWSMGHTAVIEISGSSPDDLKLLLLTSKSSPPFSLRQLTSCGIYPEQQKILVVKGVVAPRAAYEPVAAKITLVDTPGLTAVNPAHFRFERANRKLWGLTSQQAAIGS